MGRFVGDQCKLSSCVIASCELEYWRSSKSLSSFSTRIEEQHKKHRIKLHQILKMWFSQNMLLFPVSSGYLVFSHISINFTQFNPEHYFPWNFQNRTEYTAIYTSTPFQYFIKERYRICKKQKSWRSQINIKLTRFNDEYSRKHAMKYYCLKCHIMCWEMNERFIPFFFVHRCHEKKCYRFSLFSRDPDGRQISNFYWFVSLCVWWII